MAVNDGADPMPALPSILARSEDVHGLPVLGRDGDKIGIIDKVVFDKRTGHVAYVILSSGGFLGLGQSYHPLPWGTFRYDHLEDTYSVAIDKRTLEGAPSFRPDDAPTFNEAYGRRIDDYYRTPNGMVSK